MLGDNWYSQYNLIFCEKCLPSRRNCEISYICVKTVKSSTSNHRLIISWNPRNRNLLQCNCKNNVWHLICEYTLAAAINLGITFDYFVEVKKKVLACRKNKGFIKTVAMNASIKEKGPKKIQIQIKCNKEMKSVTSERQRFAVGPIASKTPTGYRASAEVISAGDIQPNTKPFSTGLIQSSIQPIPSGISLFSQLFIISLSKQPILTNINFWPRTIRRFGSPGYHHVLTKLLCCLTLFLPVMAATASF